MSNSCIVFLCSSLVIILANEIENDVMHVYTCEKSVGPYIAHAMYFLEYVLLGYALLEPRIYRKHYLYLHKVQVRLRTQHPSQTPLVDFMGMLFLW